MLAYLSLGSNMSGQFGAREENLRRAIAALPGVTKVSRYYETEPAELHDQPWFLNCAVELSTELSAIDLLKATQAIEQAQGRERKTPKGPRTLDIDILYYGDAIIAEDALEIPHPRLDARRFVLAPLCEIAPRFRDPRSGCTVAEMLAVVSDSLIVRPIEKDVRKAS